MSKDMIYKQSALDILDDFQSDIENGTPHAYSMARQRMLGLYPRNPKWIPCEESLPDEDGGYLVWAIISFVPDHVDDPSTYQGITIAGYYGNAHQIKWLGTSVEKVIAWMPLPEPMKGADDE